MVVFRVNGLKSVEQCHNLFGYLGIPIEKVDREFPADNNKVLVGESKKFIALWYKDSEEVEIYGTKNTNSINYYEINYPKLKETESHVIRTKRW